MRNAWVAVCSAATAIAGCGSSSTSPPTTTSTLTGTLEVAKFPAPPAAVEAKDEAGAVVRSTVDGQGRFQLALSKGHTYTFAVAMGATSEPMVFPRASNKLDTTVHVGTGAATVTLGMVRHYAMAPKDGFVVPNPAPGGSTAQSESISCDRGPSASADGSDGECENGRDTTTGAPCTDEPETSSNTADPNHPMAVPDHDAPDDVTGCDEGGDGETNDD